LHNIDCLKKTWKITVLVSDKDNCVNKLNN